MSINNENYTYPCGCNFKVIGPPPLLKDNTPALEIDWDDILLDCPDTYKLLSSGKTLLCFQIEKGGGRAGSKELQPENIEHIAGLSSVLRPGAANSIDEEGISTTKHYYKRKNGLEEVKSYHPALDPILGKTYNCLIFQEQSMKIAEVVAGFNKQDADSLRKAIGHKLPEEMAKIERWFLDGVKKQRVVTEEQGKEIFGWIKASQRYSFNKSLVPNTLCQTRNGYIELSDVKINEEINSPYGWVKVKDKFDHGQQEVYKITLESGKNITCTMAHKLSYNDRGKTKVGKLWEIILDRIWGYNIKLETISGIESITDINKIGKLPTIDIEVDHPSHLFYANDVVSQNSHAISYSIIAYQCAYAKTHWPHISFTSWLRDVKNRPKPFEEVQSLVSDAQAFNIEVYPPTIIDKKINFYTDGESIVFGLSNMKGVGESRVKSLIDSINKQEEIISKKISEWTWYEFLCLIGPESSKSVMDPVIACGALRNLKNTKCRAAMLEEYKTYQELSPKELEWVAENHKKYTDFVPLLKDLAKPKPIGGAFNDKRRNVIKSLVSLLENPITPLRDDINKISGDEEHYLGIELTCSKADAEPGSRFNCTCKDLSSGNIPNYAVIKAKVDNVHERTIKKGKEENIGRQMASIRFSDGTGALEDIPCFPDQWDEYKHMLTPGRVVEVKIEKPYNKKGGSSVKKVWPV